MAKRVMEFANTVQVDRSAADVFAVVSDLSGLFGKLRRKVSLEAEREVGEGAPAAGDVWRVSGNTQFGRRRGVIEVTGMTAPTIVSFRSMARGFSVDTQIMIAAVGPAKCRVTAQNDVFATTFGARLLAPVIKPWRGWAKNRLGRGLQRLKKRLER